jgi:hypothetical protein
VLHEFERCRDDATRRVGIGDDRQLDDADVAGQALDPFHAVVLEPEHLSQQCDHVVVALRRDTGRVGLVPEEAKVLVRAGLQQILVDANEQGLVDCPRVPPFLQPRAQEHGCCCGAVGKDVCGVQAIDNRVDQRRRVERSGHAMSSYYLD